MHHWNQANEIHIEDNYADNLLGLSKSSFGEKPLMSSGNDLDYDQVPSQPYDYFFDDIAKEYCCCTCSYKSTFKTNITRHLMTHSGVKPFKCQFCEYSCVQKGNLDSHIRTHTGERPFLCQVCCKVFTRKHHLNYHMTTHRKDK